MGLWPGDWYYERRYDYASEYVTIMRELWATGQSDFKGEFFTMRDCRLSPRPKAGGRADCLCRPVRPGYAVLRSYGDYQFIIGNDDFEAYGCRYQASAGSCAADRAGRWALRAVFHHYRCYRRGAHRKSDYYREGADLEAIAFMTGQANLDASGRTAAIITEMQNAFALNIGKIVGSHATVARHLDELASIDGLKGVMCIFDDFVTGTEDFGRHVMPLLRSR